MSDDDKRQIIGRTLDEHKGAKETLAHLRCRVRQILKDVADVQSLLTEKDEGRYDVEKGQFVVHRTPGSLVVREATWPSLESIGELLNEINSTKAEISIVEQRLREMGFGDYIK